MNDAIGGYFELETPAGQSLYPDALGYNSARYAFEALLTHQRARRLYLPWYTCGTMVEAAQRSGVEIRRYILDDRLQLADLPELGPEERLLYVNYFGYQTQYIQDVLAPAMPGRLIADCAQALFTPPPAGVPTLYSPRKFIGVPDGGWLANAPLGLQPPAPCISKGRFAALLGRLEDGPESWYASYVDVERDIREEGMRGMSVITRRLLQGVDYPGIQARRQANFQHLHRALQGRNGWHVPVATGVAPMCYPLLLVEPEHAEQARARLSESRIYLATYWRDVLQAQAPCQVAVRWAQCMLPLPVDQRYGVEHMDRLLEALARALD